MEVYGLWRVFWFGLGLFSSALVLCIVCTPLIPFVKLMDPYKRSLFNRICGIWARAVTCLWFRVEVINPENLPAADDPATYVYIANHQSFMDILSMFYLRREFKFVSKKAITKIPIVGYAMKRMGTITFERFSPKSTVQVVRRCIEEVQRGASVFFFPEGTRTMTGRLRVFKKGAFTVARKAKVGIVPITVLGTGDIMPAGRELRIFPSRLGVRLVVHPVISPSDVRQLGEKELRERAMEAIQSPLPDALRDRHEACVS